MPSPASLIANAVNPLLAVGVVAAPLLPPRIPPVGFWLRAGVGIGLAVFIAEAGKEGPVWPGHPTFPSGHETFALAASTILLRRDGRWAAVVLPLALLLAWALVAAHFHQPLDVAGSLLVGPPMVLLTEWLLRRAPGPK